MAVPTDSTQTPPQAQPVTANPVPAKTEKQKKKGGKGKWVALIAVGGVVLVGVVGAGAYFGYKYLVDNSDGTTGNGESVILSSEEASARTALRTSIADASSAGSAISADAALNPISDSMSELGFSESGLASDSSGRFPTPFMSWLGSFGSDTMTNAEWGMDMTITPTDDSSSMGEVRVVGEGVRAGDDMEMVTTFTGTWETYDIDVTGTIVSVDGFSYLYIDSVSDSSWDALMAALDEETADDETLTPDEQEFYDTMMEAMAESMKENLTETWICMGELSTEDDEEEAEELTEDQLAELEDVYDQYFGPDNAEYVGKETLHGEDLYHFEYDLTTAELFAMEEAICEAAGGSSYSCDRSDEADDSDMEIAGLDVWLNSDGEMRKMQYDVSDDESDMSTMFEVWNVGGASSVSEPDSCTEMDDIMMQVQEDMYSSVFVQGEFDYRNFQLPDSL